MINPLVSVIVPVYNSMEYLIDCLESILNQNYKNLEIILVNDGSTDDSLLICEKYSALHSNIKIVNKENGGLSSARNAGILVANGSYYTFVDSDDIIDCEMISSMVDLALKENASIVKIGLKRIYPSQKCIPVDGDYYVVSSKEALEKIYDPQAKIITICGKLFSAHLFEDISFPEGIYYEDEYTTPKLFYKADKIVISKKELYFYMQRENDSIIRGALNEKKIRDSLYVLEERIAFFRKIKDRKLLRLARIDYFYKLQKLKYQTRENSQFSAINRKILDKAKLFKKENKYIVINITFKQYIYKLVKKIK